MGELHVRVMRNTWNQMCLFVCYHPSPDHCRGVDTFPLGPGNRGIVLDMLIALWGEGERVVFDTVSIAAMDILEE